MIGEPRLRVVDVETTMKCPLGNNKANPFWPDNHIVMHGRHQLRGEKPCVVSVDTRNIAHLWAGVVSPHPRADYLFIGHNIGFDMLYLYKDTKLTPNDAGQRVQIWDTQLAEYLLSGQTHMFPSLDELTAKYGGVLKDTVVSDMFKAGKGADEIEPTVLAEYLKEDLRNTELIWRKQWAEAELQGMLPLIMSQMEARMATIDMAWNGMKVDHPFINDSIVRLRKEVEALGKSLLMRRMVKGVSSTTVTLDLTSPSQLSLWLRGGTHKEKEKVLVGKFKNGNDKFKQVEVERIIEPLVDLSGTTGVGDDVLEAVTSPLFVCEPLVKTVLTRVKVYRGKQKELTTYFEAIDKHLMPDGFIHPNHNHCATRTGRLSSSGPNMQNMVDGSKSNVKKSFVSRWGTKGRIVSADYGQLEIVVLAMLSGDKQLCEDIRRGIDIHTALYVDMYGRPPSTEERRNFKRCTFALVYGAGANGIATQSGLSKEDAKRFIETFYERYKGVQDYHTHIMEIVKLRRVNKGKKDKDGIPVGESTYHSPVSARKYVFTEYANKPDVKRWKKEDASFSPTEVKNYPIQGTATGDIVPLVLGILYRVLKNNDVLKDKCLLINTVHDDIMFDVHEDVLDQAVRTIKQVMENAPKYIKETWNFSFDLPLKVGVSVGLNWLEQTKLP